MKDVTELPVTSVTSPCSSQVLFSGTNDSFIEDLVDRTIPTDVWQTLKSTADANGFAALDITKQKQSISSQITTLLNDFRDDARALEKQGNKVTGFKLQVEVKSRPSRLKMTSEVVSTATGRKSSIITKNFADDESIIKEMIMSFRLEDIPFIVEEVRNDRIPSNLPRNVVDWIKTQLEKNPHWTGDDVARLQTYSLDLELYQLTINPSLLYESAGAQINTTSENAVENTSEITGIVPQTTVEKATPAFRKIMSSKTETRMSLFKNSLYYDYKPKQSDPAIETGLSSLSMNPSNSSV